MKLQFFSRICLITFCAFIIETRSLNVTHQYSFSGNAFDSVGGSGWNPEIMKGAFISNAEAVFHSHLVDDDDGHSPYGMKIAQKILRDQAFSLEIWYTPTPNDNKNNSRLFCFDGISLGRDAMSGNIIVSYFRSNDNTAKILNMITSVQFQRSQQTYIALVFGHDLYAKFYFDGELADISDWRFQGLDNHSSHYFNYIGTCPSVEGLIGVNYDGAIDEIRVWDDALSEEDVRCHAESGPTSLGLQCMEKSRHSSSGSVGTGSVLGATHIQSCHQALLLPLWVMLLGSFSAGSCVSAIVVILFCRCMYGKPSKRVKYGHRYEALDREDGLGDDGVAMQVII